MHDIPIPTEVQVRHLEEGGVLLQYNCPEGCADLVEKLTRLTDEYNPILIAPYPLMNAKLTLTAWERIDLLDGWDEKRVRGFIEAYVGKPHFSIENSDGEGEQPSAAASP